MAAVIEISGLCKSFGKYSILESVSLQIDEGSAYGLVGLNGAGKTTLLRLLLGLLRPDSGTLSLLGHNPWGHDPALYRQAGVVLENDGFWGNLTVTENLRIFAAAKGVSWTDARAYVDQFWGESGLFSFKKKVKHLSRGQRMQCALCRAFLGWPRVLVLDEPVVALDVGAYDHFRTLVATAKSQGATLVISSHQMEAIDDLCDRVGLLRDKHVSELGDFRESGESWIVVSSDDPRCGEAIARAGGTGPVFDDGAWRFGVVSAQEDIPRIVGELVSRGFPINEVRAVSQTFSSRIRQHLSRDANNEAGGRGAR